jgi:RNA polymerase sigma-70 factor, ECF subfamily
MFNRNSPDAHRRAADVVNLLPTDCSGAFESEAMPHLNDLYRAAFHMLQHSVKASDAVHETYFRASNAFGECQRAMDCKTWLFQILFNVVRHKYRSCSKRIDGSVSAAEQLECATLGTLRTDNQNQSMQSQESSFSTNTPDLIVSAMNRVPPDFREALLLVDCQGFSYKDAAEILGLSADVIARRIVLGRNYLYSELETCGSALVAAAH